MEAIKKMECIVVDDRQYQVEGFGQDLRDGSFQSVCQIVTTQGDSAQTRRLTFLIFSRDQDLAAEVALLCGADIVSKEHTRINNGI